MGLETGQAGSGFFDGFLGGCCGGGGLGCFVGGSFDDFLKVGALAFQLAGEEVGVFHAHVFQFLAGYGVGPVWWVEGAVVSSGEFD